MPGKHKYTVNEEYFSVLNEENSYWAGFIAADGCIHPIYYTKTPSKYRKIGSIKTREHLNISIDVCDREHLETFKKCINFTGPVNDYNNNSKFGFSDSSILATINIYNGKIVSDLRDNFNITPQKSLTYIPPDLPLECSLPFILGLLDGDGSIYYVKRDKTYGVGFNGTRETVSWVKNIIDHICPHSSPKGHTAAQVRPSGSIFKYDIIGMRAIRLLDTFNGVKNTPRLERKLIYGPRN